MKSVPIGIAIVGCGNVAGVHAEAIRHVPGLRLAAVCSRSAASARQLAQKHSVPWHSELSQLLSDPAVEAVSICTPSGTHSELGCAAARAGRHVMVEKPIDISLSRADELIGACEKAGVRLGVSLQSRFLDAPRILKGAIDAGRFGRQVMASAYIKWYRSPEYYRSASWRGTLALDGGGALINQAIHTVDLLRWMMGPVQAVAAFSGRQLHQAIEGEDTLVAALRFQNGALGVIEAATSAFPGFKRRLEITGTEGTAILDGDNITTWSLRDGSPNPAPPSKDVADGSANPMAIDYEGHRRVMEDFAGAIRENRKPFVDGHEGRQSLELVLAAYESARRWQPEKGSGHGRVGGAAP